MSRSLQTTVKTQKGLSGHLWADLFMGSSRQDKNTEAYTPSDACSIPEGTT